MTFDGDQYKTTTRQQWEDYARESYGALHQMLGSMTAADQTSVWEEMEIALGQYETSDGIVGPCELVIAGATR
jgi:hypothetical protein